MATTTPMVNTNVIASTLTPGPVQPPLPKPNERSRTALEFGCVLQELVADCWLLGKPGTQEDSNVSNVPFIPDFSSSFHDHSKSNHQRLEKLESKLFELAPDKLPSAGLEIADKIETLRSALSDRNGSSPDPDASRQTLHEAIKQWDRNIISQLLSEDSTTALDAYDVGKALSLSRWRIRCDAKLQPCESSELPAASWDVWQEQFHKERVDTIQRRLNVLNTALGPQAVVLVSASLSYWRRAVSVLAPSQNGKSLSAKLPKKRGLQGTTKESIDVDPEELHEALETQAANWIDLLLGRRTPEDFPMADIVTSLSRTAIITWGARLLRWVIPIIIAVAVLAIVAALISAGVFSFRAVATNLPEAASGAAPPEAGGLIGSVVTAVTGVATILVAQGRSIFNRGTGTVNQALERAKALESQLTGVVRRVGELGAPLGLPQVSWHNIKQDSLSTITEQIKQEELKLAVSQPLVNCFLNPDDDPFDGAKRFLSIVYGDKDTNLDRLQRIFEDLSKHYRTAPSAPSE